MRRSNEGEEPDNLLIGFDFLFRDSELIETLRG
jgi:hypothetical protein